MEVYSLKEIILIVLLLIFPIYFLLFNNIMKKSYKFI